jgi:hypothetical protein
MSVATDKCSKSIVGSLTPLPKSSSGGVPCYNNAGTWREVVDASTNPAPKSSWDMSAPFGFTVPDVSNLLGKAGSTTAPATSSAAAPAASTSAPGAAAPPAPAAATVTGTSTAKGGLDGRGILIIASVGLVLLAVVTFVSTGSILATLVVIALIVGIALILNKLGYIQIDLSNGTLNIEYHQTAASPAPATAGQTSSSPLNVTKKEVFYVGGNDYNYDDAPALCAAYGAELATYDQVNDAYNMGAEWCGYGWSQGAMALFPTQKNTWAALQTDPTARTNCGRPGVNGGYFDPATKFGVNCYGVKPDNTNNTFPLPPPGTDNSAFNAAMNKFKAAINTITVSPFNRSGWSVWNLSAHT